MKNLFAEFGRSIVATLFFAVILCGIYPVVVFAAGQLLFPHQANGSLLVDKSGAIRGSALLAQNFTGAQYFHPRPSAAGTNGYDPTSSGGSNLGPTNKSFIDSVKQRTKDVVEEDGVPASRVPVDMVTASGSGLDPEISPASAEIQIDRVAKARGMSAVTVRALVIANTRSRWAGFLGEPGVNVLELNL